MKPLLLGESPSLAAGPDGWKRPLSGRVCTTLCQLAGLETSYETLQEHFQLANLLVKPEQRADSWWVSLDARTRFEQTWESTHSSSVICLGRKVAVAAGLGPVWGEWITRRSYMGAYRPLTAIPHPSGLNRLYNDPENRAVATLVLKEALAACAGA